MKGKGKPRNKAFDQMKVFVLLVAVVLIAVMFIQRDSSRAPEETMDSTQTIKNVLSTAGLPDILGVDVFDDIQRVQITFRTTDRVQAIELDLQFVACAVKDYLPPGYDLRLAGELITDMGAVDAFIAPDKLAGLNCKIKIDWPAVAFEYHIASNLNPG